MIDGLGDETGVVFGEVRGGIEQVATAQISERVHWRRTIAIEGRPALRHPVGFLGGQNGEEELPCRDQGCDSLRPWAACDPRTRLGEFPFETGHEGTGQIIGSRVAPMRADQEVFLTVNDPLAVGCVRENVRRRDHGT